MIKINVTKTFLPPIEEYEKYLKKIWDSNLLTNQGPLLREFENGVEDYLHIDNFHFVTNGTIALQLALNALDITEGEVITTPFSYVASTSAILWERCKPMFVDIDPNNFCIDPQKIEKAITKNTKAILAVHVFGLPCDVELIESIANKHRLKVIYDGAHAFGVKYKSQSLLSFGDITTCSFHSTKLFHTIEGGAVIAKNKHVSDKIELIKRFGHHGDEHFLLGINAKSSEFQAAMGLCNLKYIDQIINNRKNISEQYDKLLSDTSLITPKIPDTVDYNYAYYPVVFSDEENLLKAKSSLEAENIFPRRYFYPSLNKLPYISDYQNCKVSEDISKRIMCLPLFSGLDKESVNRICEIIRG